MVYLGLRENFRHKILEWDEMVIPIKEPGSLIGKNKLTQWNMLEVSMETSEPYSTREATETFVNIIGSAYAKY